MGKLKYKMMSIGYFKKSLMTQRAGRMRDGASIEALP